MSNKEKITLVLGASVVDREKPILVVPKQLKKHIEQLLNKPLAKKRIDT